MHDNILKTQLDYYRARAQEYDESVHQTGRFAGAPPGDPVVDEEWIEIIQALRHLKPGRDTLELACGTGIWTRELLPLSASLTAIDGAPEMLDANRAKLDAPAIRYQCADLFAWEPDRAYDLVFFGFWLSHVPPERLDAFLDNVARATQIGGQVFIVDEPARGKQLSGTSVDGLYQTRQLHDGRRFKIFKVYYDPALIQAELAHRGFAEFESLPGKGFFYLCGTRVR